MYDASSSIKTPAIGTPAAWVAALTSHGAQEAERIVAAYFKYAAVIGYNADLALAQACIESAWFQDYKWTQFRNPAGIGSTSRDVPGNVFPSIEAGITAQLAHQAAYAESAASCPIEQLTGPEYATLFQDPRHLFHKATPAIGAWNGAWAVPGSTYAEDISALANSVVGSGPPAPTPQPGGNVPNIIDVRGQLPTNPGGGSGQTHFPKSGIIWHYTGPAVDMNADEMTMLISYANYHIGPYLNEAGIAYHYDIGADGTIRLLRNPEAVLWHCASWPENASHYAIHFELGEGQHATDAQLASGIALGDFLRAQDGFGREQCKGHREVSSTSCPGTLMDDLVYPYRAGSDAPVSDYIFFKETGHGYANAFRDYFQKMGGVPIIGLPLSEEMDDPQKQKINDKVMTVQYAERERFEYHPELPLDPNAPGGGQVLFTRLGALAAAAAGLTGPGIPPTLAPPVMKGAKK